MKRNAKIMQSNDLPNKPYELLGQMSQGTPPQGLPAEGSNSDDKHATQELTTAYIVALYYSALANLYLQSTLPKTLDELNAENPRLKIAFDRSYADFIAARRWVNKEGNGFITTSTAKHYYDEVLGMQDQAIMNTASFYVQSNAGAITP
jgi:hypothetical protein